MTPPRFWRQLVQWSLTGDRRPDVEADLAEEFAALAAESPVGARRWYRRQAIGFALRRVFRIPRWWTAVDVRLAWRLARRQPVATLTSMAALAAVICLSVAAFTFARSFVFPDLDLPDGDRLHQIVMHRVTPGAAEHATPAEIVAWMRDAKTVAAVGAFRFVSPPFSVDDDDPRPIEGAFVTPGPFARLAPPPLAGRLLVESDAAPGAPLVVVIGESVWRSRLAADSGVIGRVVAIAGERRVIVGVLPAGFGFPLKERVWLPLSVDSIPTGARPRLGVWVIPAVGTAEAAVEAELTSLARRATSGADAEKTAVSIVPYVDGFTGGDAGAIAVAILGLLMIFLCAVSLNVANLMLARCAARANEFAVRTALGASRARLVGQLFLESLVTSGLAGVVGVLVVNRLLAVVQWRTAGLPFWMDLSLDASVIGYAAALAVIASSLTGVVPALRITRGQSRGFSPRIAPVAFGRFAAVLLAAQLAASLVLLAAGGLLVEGLVSVTRRSPVADQSRILTAILYRDPGATGIRPAWGSTELMTLRVRLETELSRLPGANRAALSLSVPRADKNIGLYEAEGLAGVIRAQQTLAGPGFFETLGVPAHVGRVFTGADARPGAHPAVVVSGSFADFVFKGSGAVGRRIREARREGRAPAPWLEIVGVVADLDMAPGDRTTHGEIFEPLIGSDFMYASVRTAGDPMALDAEFRGAVARVDPRIRVTDVQPLTEVGWESRALLGGGAGVLTVLGLLALLLSLAGMYALASLSVASRTREIGVRLALGGSNTDILRPVLGRTLRQLVAGAIAGSVVAVLLGRAMTAMPFAIPASVGFYVPLATVLLVGAGVLSIWTPARRALRISPVETLRGE